jgi:hypothetical protein
LPAPSLIACLIAGALIGLAGVLLFGLIHAAIIVPIWTRLLRGVPFALVAGVAMGWALYELRRACESRGRASAIVTLTFGGLVWTTLIPMTVLGMVLRAAGVHGVDNTWEVIAECLLAVGTGAAAGRVIGGRWRSGLALGAASLAVTLTQAGPIPVVNSVRAARLFAALAVVYVLCGVALGLVASLVSRRLDHNRRAPRSTRPAEGPKLPAGEPRSSFDVPRTLACSLRCRSSPTRPSAPTPRGNCSWEYRWPAIASFRGTDSDHGELRNLWTAARC